MQDERSKEMGYDEDLAWTHLAQEQDQCQVLVKKIMKSLASFTYCVAIIFTIMTPLIHKRRRKSVILRIIRLEDCKKVAN